MEEQHEGGHSENEKELSNIQNGGLASSNGDDMDYKSEKELNIEDAPPPPNESPFDTLYTPVPTEDVVEVSSVPRWTDYWKKIMMYAKFPQLKLYYRMSGLEIELPSKPLEVQFPVNTQVNDKVTLWYGDITRLRVDAIVNAAHAGLTGGGGVDGYIHMRAGEELINECSKLGGCDTGEAKITAGYKLPAQHVIHTVGPCGEDAVTLRWCYLSCLNLALEKRLKTIAFPCISTGHYDYPQVEASKVVLKTVREWLDADDHASQIDLIIFCVNTVENEVVYEEFMPKFFPA